MRIFAITSPLVVLCLLSTSVSALQYYISNPAQCQPLNLTWSDARGTLHLLLMPVTYSDQGFIQNITLPPTATSPYLFDNFTQPAGLDFMAVMWDDEGYPGTGVTNVLTVGSSDDTSCLRAPGSVLPDFFFYTSTDNPGQCSNVDITWQANYTPPAHIVGMIPGGDIWNIHTIGGAGETAYTWRVDVKEGTRMVLTMPDAGPIGTGGSTGLWTIGGGDSSCLTGDSPASITSSATSSQTSGASATASVSGVGGGGGRPGSTSGAGQANDSGSDPGSGDGKSKTNVGAIVGGVVGGVAALLIILLLALCLLRRRRRRSRQHSAQNMFGTTPAAAARGTGIFDRSRRNTPATMDLLGAGEEPQGGRASQEYLHNANDDSPGSYEPQPYLGGYAAPPTSSGFPGTRTSHESAPMSETTTSRSGAGGAAAVHRQSFGMSDFGTLAAASSEGNRMSSMGESITTGGSPQLAAGQLPIAAMYPSPTSQSSPGRGAAARSNSTRKRRAGAGLGPDGRPATRFVLHQDAGEIEDAGPNDEGDVVEMPPRYDQLRPGAKASSENLNS
ncbi:hypothetical protein NliqN6_6828 [Naganishia liquefaciens]|uniref:Uncharacterized protein n=1 Tax=Naganishia liquefaciens TaxID=104408 RepID=A0A8H3U0L8_9TREE|nr:hypothetical protein NliqN6_6828 [Naganishia liquefaciens]